MVRMIKQDGTPGANMQVHPIGTLKVNSTFLYPVTEHLITTKCFRVLSREPDYETPFKTEALAETYVPGLGKMKFDHIVCLRVATGYSVQLFLETDKCMTIK